MVSKNSAQCNPEFILSLEDQFFSEIEIEWNVLKLGIPIMLYAGQEKILSNLIKFYFYYK